MYVPATGFNTIVFELTKYVNNDITSLKPLVSRSHVYLLLVAMKHARCVPPRTKTTADWFIGWSRYVFSYSLHLYSVVNGDVQPGTLY